MSRRKTGQPPVVRKAGLTYQLIAEDIETTMTLSRVKLRSESLSGILSVKTGLDVQTFGGVLLVGSINLMAARTRQSYAKRLAEKTKGFNVEWEDLLDFFAERTLALELNGEAITEVGDLPVPKTAGAFALTPWVPKSGPCLFYGEGGSGKSRFALAGALSVQLGRQILPEVIPNIKGNILYLDWETDKETVAERVQHICAGLGVPPVKIGYRRCIRPLADDVEYLSAYVAQKEIVFIVVDSAAAAIGQRGEHGDANEGALKLFEALRIIGVPVIIVDHVSKQEMRMSGKARGALPYGSIYKVNMARAAWEVRAEKTPGDVEDEESVHITSFHNTKANDSRLHDPYAIRAEFDEASVKFELYEGPLEGETETRTIAKDAAGQIEAFLRGQWASGPAIAEFTGLDASTVRSTLNRGKGRRFIKDEANNTWTAAVTKLTALPGGGGVQ